jgi:hypothetical protein
VRGMAAVRTCAFALARGILGRQDSWPMRGALRVVDDLLVCAMMGDRWFWGIGLARPMKGPGDRR